MAAFTYQPDYGPQVTETPRVRMTQYGDGYSQRAADGLHPIAQKWSLKFSARSQTEAKGILSFFRTQGGTTAFDFIDPLDSSTHSVICQTWSMSPSSYGLYDVQATFQEVF